MSLGTSRTIDFDIRPGQATTWARVASRAMLSASLTLLLLCAVGNAEAQAYAPQFSVQALDGGSITPGSLSGNVVLLQFWATWCPYCRNEQPAVDKVERAFASKGLIVLAVDVGESAEAVRAYLQRNPRSC